MSPPCLPFAAQVRELEAELEELRSTMEALKATLEAETLSKVDLQNHIQSLKEEMAFMKKVHSEVRDSGVFLFLFRCRVFCLLFCFPRQEVASLRLKLHELNTEHTDFDMSLQTRKFEDAIDELREKSEMELAQYKAEMDLSYKERVSDRALFIYGVLPVVDCHHRNVCGCDT